MLFVWGVFSQEHIKAKASSKGSNFAHEETLCSAWNCKSYCCRRAHSSSSNEGTLVMVSPALNEGT